MSEREEEINEKQEAVTEALILNQILTSRDISILSKNKLTLDFFPAYSDELRFILDEFEKYKRVPDISVILAKFPDYQYFKVHEHPDSLVDKILEEYGYRRIITTLNDVSERSHKDSIAGAQLMFDRAKSLLDIIKRGTIEPYDVIAKAYEREADYVLRTRQKGLVGISTGIPDLDKITKGWRPVDFVVIAARTQEGKSWVILYFLIKAWLQGHKVLMFDLENDPESVTGFRFDTLLGHFSNDGLMDGNEVLDENDRDKVVLKSNKDYSEYIKSLSQYTVPFKIITPTSNGGHKFTPAKIEDIIDQEKPGIIGIDQLSLLSSSKRANSIRESFVSVTQDIRQMTRNKRIPILACSQANRDNAKQRMKDKEASPELHQLSESDSVAQDSTRVITIRKIEEILKLSVKKNTYGRSDLDALCKWDIDKGSIVPIIRNEDDQRKAF